MMKNDLGLLFETKHNRASSSPPGTNPPNSQTQEPLRVQWCSGQMPFYRPSGAGDHWNACKDKVDRSDEEFCVGWNSEIDSLLTFAGLFSSVVTAFAIESYKWLQPDPQGVNTQILLNISAQLAGNNATTLPPFSPSASSIRINTFWFLSLTFSLAAALFGMVCKQWLRRYHRDASRIPNEMGLGLHKLRREGFAWWGAADILGALPLLLEFALIFFFIGLVDFLLGFDRRVAILVITCTLIGVAFLVVTTLAPAFQYAFYWARKGSQSDDYIHPPMFVFKSPQSRLFLRLATWILPFPSTEKPLDWTTFEIHFISNHITFGRYTARGIAWLDRTYSHSRDMVHQISLCFQELELQYVERGLASMNERIDAESPCPRPGSFESYAKTLPKSSNEDVTKDVAIVKYLNSRLHINYYPQNEFPIVERCVRVLNSSCCEVSPSLFYTTFRDLDMSQELRWQRAMLLQNLMRDQRMSSESASLIASEIIEVFGHPGIFTNEDLGSFFDVVCLWMDQSTNNQFYLAQWADYFVGVWGERRCPPVERFLKSLKNAPSVQDTFDLV